MICSICQFEEGHSQGCPKYLDEFQGIDKIILERQEKELDPLKETRKYCFYRGKEQYKGKKPYGVYFGTMTSHLKTLSDWTTARSIADQEEKRGELWFKTFFGSLKVQPWQEN